ncbi:MAG: UDP-N-acetylmuramoyl-L-alanine--D-glutamate ligase [Candidatus Riflebacteria bacterium]|nr:UDP-N-acetylmuramoyl-L-alanine--D-glutamate ligase [Candidatus Riflebacteria bacterium]
MDIKGKKISIVGAAKSGLAAARTLYKGGARIFISDIQPEEKLKNTLIKEDLLDKVSYEAGGNTDKVLDSDFIVLSPGVRPDIPVLVKASEKHIPIYSEIEIAYRLSKGKRLVVTGSNGKTTTTTLLSLFCREQFNKVFLGGNIGIPMMSFATETTDDSVQVLEVSSFQLETICDFRPDIGVITNFFENHLDRYPNYKAYIDAKKNIALNMGPDQCLILNADQKLMLEMEPKLKCKTAWFGREIKDKKPAVTIKNGNYVFINKEGSETILFDEKAPKLIGSHNQENIMCASLAAVLAGVEPKRLEKVVREFSGVEHRLEWVREVSGVNFINDSKGTNCAASITALKACKRPLILIAGGRDKGTDLTEWVETIRQTTRGVILFGEAKDRFRASLEGVIPLKTAKNLEQSVNIAYQWADKGDTVLLSPACSSYDQYPNFEVRGKHFKELVNNLTSK